MSVALLRRGLLLSILAPILLALLALAGCGPMTVTLGTPPNHNRIAANVVETDGGWRNEQVAIVDVTGMIHNSAKPGLLSQGENPVALLQEKLEAACDKRVRAVILRLNTPGGTVTASDAMYREVKRFKKETGKPVVALMMDVTASGGYYLACSADEIVAYPTSVTGSIGVIMQLVTVKGALGKLGIGTEAITSGPNKDIASPFGTLTDEQRAILRGMVDDFYRRFVAIVKEARPKIPADRFASLTDGRVVTGEQAAAAGLADSVGDLHDAFALAKKMAGLTKADLVVYRRPFDYVNSPYASTPVGAGTQINLAQINIAETLPEGSAGFYYLWQPDLGGGALSH
ncbi:MAG: signal peptide peptidase SppA [Planctomycetota bacterium]|nr:signal peptide peptidase SppA [Planctomycetota bacterium]